MIIIPRIPQETKMQLWCPFADKRPLGPQTEEKIGTPRVFVVHTMVGYLAGTESMFKKNGYTGTESHFGIGGSWDGARDGDIWQWQDLSHSADAQYDANAFATSVETSDGAKHGVRWSDKQAEALVELGVWWCEQTGHPAELVKKASGAGFGYHAQFKAWNKSAHDCPGSVRLKQYTKEIIPEIAHLLGTGEKPVVTTNRTLTLTRPAMRGHDVERLQGLLNKTGAKLKVDGVYGKATVAAVKVYQKAHKLTVDGTVGPRTWDSLTA
jgi:hypothetical protein